MKISDFFTPEKILEFFLILFIFLVLLILLNIFIKRIKFLLRDKVSFQTLSILGKVLIWSFIILFVIIVLMYYGVNLTGLLAVGGFASIIIGFATQKVVGNAIAGMFLIIERPIKIGQLVKIDNIFGFVEDIKFLSTIIRAAEGEFVRIPNEHLFTSVITNLSENVARRIDYLIGISYGSDFNKAKNVILNVLDSEPFVLAYPKPEVFVENFAASSVDVHIRFWAPTEKRYEISLKMLPIIRENLELNGIHIPFPQMEVKIHNLKELNKLQNL